MNRNLLIYSVLGLLIMGAAAASLIFYDQWQQEKKVVAAMQKEIKIRDLEIKALKSNKEADLNKVAAEFVNELFSYDSKNPSKASERLQDRVIGQAKGKINEKPKEGEFGEHGHLEGDILSKVNIIDTQYNKTGSDMANVLVKFENEIVMDGIKAKTINEMKVTLQFIDNDWKVADYSLQQIL